jgi:hypothetical protein
MSTPDPHDISIEPSVRELWETPLVVSCAVRDTNKVKSNFAEDPNQGKAGS